MQQYIFASFFLFAIIVIAILMVLDWVARRKTKDELFIASPIVSAKNLSTKKHVEAIFYNGENKTDVLDWLAQETRYAVNTILDSLLLGDSFIEKNVYLVRVQTSRLDYESPKTWRDGIPYSPLFTLYAVPEAEFDVEYELLHWHILETVPAGV